MKVPITAAEGADLLYREAACLDERDWDGWLGMFAEDAVFWVPAWKSEDEMTEDPGTELSLIRYECRADLEDRVWRLRSGLSAASIPLRRTAHVISNVRLVSADAGEAELRSVFAVHHYDPKLARQYAAFGRYEHLLRREEGAWRIARKKIVLLNDYVPTVLDVYAV